MQLSFGDAYPYMAVISVVSNMAGLQALVTLFKISQDPLSSYRIKPKFFTVQFTLIITSVQSLVTGTLAKFGVIKCLGPFNPRVNEKCKSLKFIIFCLKCHYYSKCTNVKPHYIKKNTINFGQITYKLSQTKQPYSIIHMRPKSHQVLHQPS